MQSELLLNKHESEKPANRQGKVADRDRGRFSFTHNWFELVQEEWGKRTASLRGRELRILEIGSFEGASTTWILDNLLDHPDSRMIAIDTFEGGMEHHELNKPDVYGLSSLEARFRSNVSKCRHFAKLRIMKMRSDDGLLALRGQADQFDLIYIDASHVAIDVLHDAVLCWRMLSVHGIMVFDDVRWKGYMEDCYNPRIAIKAFVSCAEPEVETEETESQLWVKKVLNKIPPTPNPDPALYYWDKNRVKEP